MGAGGQPDGPRYEPIGSVRRLVVLVHGVGADGTALFDLAARFSDRLDDTAFVAPNAPFPADNGRGGFQWFSVEDPAPAAYLTGARVAEPILNAFIDRELERYGLHDDDLALLGFSQGAMMALHTSLRRPRACAGVAAYSGLLIAPTVLADEIKSRPPVILVHGDADRQVPARHMPVAAAALAANEVPVTTEIRPGLGHRVDADAAAVGLEFLERVLGRGADAESRDEATSASS